MAKSAVKPTWFSTALTFGIIGIDHHAAHCLSVSHRLWCECIWGVPASSIPCATLAHLSASDLSAGQRRRASVEVLRIRLSRCIVRTCLHDLLGICRVSRLRIHTMPRTPLAHWDVLGGSWVVIVRVARELPYLPLLMTTNGCSGTCQLQQVTKNYQAIYQVYGASKPVPRLLRLLWCSLLPCIPTLSLSASPLSDIIGPQQIQVRMTSCMSLHV